MVTHNSTTQARRCLTTEIGRDPVFLDEIRCFYLSMVVVNEFIFSNKNLLFKDLKFKPFRLQPYQDENTGSRLISEVNHPRAWVVLGWVTTWEVQVL